MSIRLTLFVVLIGLTKMNNGILYSAWYIPATCTQYICDSSDVSRYMNTKDIWQSENVFQILMTVRWTPTGGGEERQGGGRSTWKSLWQWRHLPSKS